MPPSADARLDARVDRTHQTALAAALDLLLDEGWDALTHVRLANASGISRMTLYRHWPTRLNLLHDAVQKAAEVTHAPVSGDLRTDLTSELRLIHKQLLGPRPAQLLATVMEQGQWDAQMARLRDKSVGEVHTGLESILRSGVSAGSLPADLDVAAANSWLIGPLAYQILVNDQSSTPGFIAKVVDSFLCRFEHKSDAAASPRRASCPDRGRC